MIGIGEFFVGAKKKTSTDLLVFTTYFLDEAIGA
jgi:hypothetical protein